MNAFDNLSFEEILALLDQIWEGPASAPLPAKSNARLRDHIEQLVQEHKIRWEEKPIRFHDAHGSLAPDDRSITAPMLTSELAYFVTLHEIGHIVLQLPSHDDLVEGPELPTRFYGNEASVWEWALDESIVPPSPDAAEKIPRFLHSDDPGDSPEEARERVRRKLAEVRHGPAI